MYSGLLWIQKSHLERIFIQFYFVFLSDVKNMYSCGLPAVMNENDSKHKPEQHKIMNRCLVLSISNWRHKQVTITRVVVYIISSLPFTFENTRCKYVVEETNPDINRQFETA